MMQRRTWMLTVVTAGLLLSVLVWFNYSAVLPLIVEDWGLSSIQAGIIFGVFQAGYMLAIIPMGMFADRYPTQIVIGLGAFGTGFASLAFAFVATGFLSGTVLRFVGGMAMAGVYVPGMRFVSDWYPSGSRGRAMGIYVGAFSLSSGLSFLVASSIASMVSWRTAITATSLAALLAGPLVLFFARDSPTATRQDRLSFSRTQTLLQNRAYLAAVGSYSWHSWELFGVRNWLVAYLVTVPAITSGGSSVLAGTLAGLTFVVGGFGNLVGGWLSDCISRPLAISIALATSAVLSFVLVAFRGLPLWAITAVLILYGVALTADSAPISTSITEVVDDDRVGTALSVQSFIGFAATVISPVVFGLALDIFGFMIAFWTLAFGAIMGLLSLGLFYQITRKVS